MTHAKVLLNCCWILFLALQAVHVEAYGPPRKAKSTLIRSMEEHQIIPDVIDTAPAQVLTVNYPSGVSVTQGNILTPTNVKDIPTVRWQAYSNAFYTLCLTDPDAPSRQNPVSREWHHWLVGNIPGSKVADGETLTQYVGSGPPQGSGLHRYVFLVYKQPGRLTFDEIRISNRTATNRGSFSIRNFATKYNLGQPLAGNFYQAEWDEYVPTMHRQVGIID